MRNNFFTNRVRLISAIILFQIITGFLFVIHAQQRKVTEPVLIDSSFNLYQTGKIFLSGQPNREEIASLLDKGVTLIINVKTAGEMRRFAEEEFDEQSYIKDHHADYFNIGVGGTEGYKPEVIDAIAEKIKTSKGDVLIHCGSGFRATIVWMAWLVKTGQCSIDDAIKLGKKARYSTPFEDLLGYPVNVRKVK